MTGFSAWELFKSIGSTEMDIYLGDMRRIIAQRVHVEEGTQYLCEFENDHTIWLNHSIAELYKKFANLIVLLCEQVPTLRSTRASAKVANQSIASYQHTVVLSSRLSTPTEMGTQTQKRKKPFTSLHHPLKSKPNHKKL